MAGSPAPYDVPAMIQVVGQLLLSQGGQEAFMRLLAERKVTLADLVEIWNKQPKAEAPFLGDSNGG